MQRADELLAAQDDVEATRVLLDLPAELLLLILERCPYDELCSVRRSAKPLRALTRQTLHSSVWRSRATNTAVLQLHQLAVLRYPGRAVLKCNRDLGLTSGTCAQAQTKTAKEHRHVHAMSVALGPACASRTRQAPLGSAPTSL